MLSCVSGDKFENLLDLAIGIGVPIARPNPMNMPSETDKYLLAKPVAVSRRTRRVVHRPVAFDAQAVTPRSLGVHDGQINPVPGTPNLAVDGQALRD